MEIPVGASILVVREPWVSMILDGKKTMEIRGFKCNKTPGEYVYFSESGTGTIAGVARFVESIRFHTEEEMRNSQDKHCVPAYAHVPYKKIYGWVFSDAQRIPPVKYHVKRGSIVWRKYMPVLK